MKKRMGMLLAIVLCFNTIAMVPALAVDIVSDQNAEEQVKRMTYDKTEYLSSSAGITLTVVYSYHDGSGGIAGIKSITITGYPSNISNVSATYRLSNDYAVITLTYIEDGEWTSDTVMLWA